MAEAEHVILLPTRQELLGVKANIGPAYPFLERLTLDMYHVKYDFDGDLPAGGTSPGKFEINTNNSGTLIILADQTNGIGRLSTIGSTTNDYCNLTLPELNCQPQLSCTMAVRLAVTSVDDCKVEVGFTYLTTNTSVINVLTTPSFTGTTSNNSAVWVFDTNDSGNSDKWQAVSCKAGVVATEGKIEPSSLNATYPSAGIFQTLIVALFADSDTQHAKYFILDANGYKAYESAWTSAAITYNDNLSPWVGVTTRTSTLKTVDIDYIEVWQRRTVT
ncbi:hypothetical protein LCGC14_2237280 [marine sediment metagenome]|uniref:Uncharacterized protein n=1 Tax=marine sediment metagenome TaxID=412755 RepID=A0A0F9DU38_9ZZZZ